MTNIPFSGPPPDLPDPADSTPVLRPRAADPIHMSAMHSQQDWMYFNQAIHSRRMAHRAVEELRRVNVLMWMSLLVSVPAFGLGCIVGAVVLSWSAKMNAGFWIGGGVGSVVGLALFVSDLLKGVQERLTRLMVERFGRSVWE